MSKETIQFKIRELDPDLIAPSTTNMNKTSQGGTKTVIIGKPGCFEVGTPVLMYDGNIKTVENVRVGDVVMGDDSTKRNVLEICRNYQNMFKINMEEGGSYTVNENHHLVLMSSQGEVIEITVKDYISKSPEWKSDWTVYKTAVEFEEKDVPFNSYMIGLILGNKNLDKLDDKVREWIVRYSKKEDFDVQELIKISRELECAYFIPTEYKINSRQVRLELLAGMIDSNGFYNSRLDQYEITYSFKFMIEDIIYLCRSLGFRVTCRKIVENENFEINYKITLKGRLDTIPCMSLKNKVEEKKDSSSLLNYDFTVEYVGIDNYYGFILDGNHRFLLGTFDVVRNTGKSTLITSLLYEKSHIYSSGMVCSGTEDSNHHYSQLFPETFIYNKLEKQKIEDFIKRQKIARQHLPNPWSVLLLDDCTDDPKLFADPLFQNIFKNGRHYKMWFILSLQYCLDVKPVIRTNIDGTFILRETNLRNRKSLWENYAGVIPDFSMFCDIMDQLTTDYTALYIHNATTSNKIEDCVFWYKAKPITQDFKFGSQDYWDFHDSRFDPQKSILLN